MKIGHEQVYTWLALFCARPSSGHLDLMSKFTGDLFSKYVTVIFCCNSKSVTVCSSSEEKIKFANIKTKDVNLFTPVL